MTRCDVSERERAERIGTLDLETLGKTLNDGVYGGNSSEELRRLMGPELRSTTVKGVEGGQGSVNSASVRIPAFII